MAWRLSGAKPLSEPMYRLLLIGPLGIYVSDIWINFIFVHGKLIWNILRQSVSHFVLASVYYYLVALEHTNENIDSLPYSWWCHQMETFSVSLALREGNPPVTDGFPQQMPVTQSFDIFLVCAWQTFEQITSLTIVYSTVYSGADQRKHQSFASLAFVRGIHRWPVNSHT